MRMLTFAKRNLREMIRDPLMIGFSLGFPLILILLLSAIQASIPVSLFEIQNLAPGITVFALSAPFSRSIFNITSCHFADITHAFIGSVM